MKHIKVVFVAYLLLYLTETPYYLKYLYLVFDYFYILSVEKNHSIRISGLFTMETFQRNTFKSFINAKLQNKTKC